MAPLLFVYSCQLFGFFWLWSVRHLLRLFNCFLSRRHPFFEWLRSVFLLTILPQSVYSSVGSLDLKHPFFAWLRCVNLLTLLPQFAHSSFGTCSFSSLGQWYFFYACEVCDIVQRLRHALRKDKHEVTRRLPISLMTCLQETGIFWPQSSSTFWPSRYSFLRWVSNSSRFIASAISCNRRFNGLHKSRKCLIGILCREGLSSNWWGSIIGGRTFRKPPYFVPSKPQTAFVFF